MDLNNSDFLYLLISFCYVLGSAHRTVLGDVSEEEVHKAQKAYPPELTLEKVATMVIYFHFVHLIIFTMGPHGPVWTHMDPYIILFCFAMI